LKIVIVDDGSTDNTFSLAHEFAKGTDIKTVVISSNGSGLGASRQIAVDNSEGDYLLFEDDDLVLAPNFISKQVEFMDENPKVGAAEGICVSALKGNTLARYVGARYIRESTTPEVLGTGGAIFRSEALESVGGFDVRIKGAMEDVDISRRLKMFGWLLAANRSARLYAKHPLTTLKALWRKNRWFGYGNHFEFHKYGDRRLIVIYFPPLVLWGGFRMSLLTYSFTKNKKDFVFVLFFLIGMMANFMGFNQAHYEQYGHAISD
jgi:glycosyltransferase involved in cell wall biosynthesis